MIELKMNGKTFQFGSWQKTELPDVDWCCSKPDLLIWNRPLLSINNKNPKCKSQLIILNACSDPRAKYFFWDNMFKKYTRQFLKLQYKLYSDNKEYSFSGGFKASRQNCDKFIKMCNLIVFK
jgi:hypothetical protein